LWDRSEEKRRPSFLKKRSKKLLSLEVGAGERSATAIKSFLVPAGRASAFFFQKRTSFFLQYVMAFRLSAQPPKASGWS
jgi:hypothetical protein